MYDKGELDLLEHLTRNIHFVQPKQEKTINYTIYKNLCPRNKILKRRKKEPQKLFFNEIED